MELLKNFLLYPLQSKQKTFVGLNILFNGVSIATLVLLASLFGFLIAQSLSFFISESTSVFSEKYWYPLDGEFGLLPMLYGTLIVSVLAISITVPASIFIALAIFVLDIKVLKSVFTKLLEVCNSIPSVVFGFLGLQLLVPNLAQSYPPGASILAGGLVLSTMLIPFTSLSFLSLIKKVWFANQITIKSLGISRFYGLEKIVLPLAFKSSLSIVLLQLMRAIGETMIVAMVCGNIPHIPDSVFAPVRTLTANIALEMPYAEGSHQKSLYLCGLIIMVVCLGLSVLIKKVEAKNVY